ncbi:unnamed protein product [Strongylus vulgaris]|uniref:Uncharacterized protein n=1 Tax=Strongylus vulgaris TaxID=40348 RepID=A0A3P7J2U7_STRVU|nr:unnamed protein product [Strongylus vulgaris]
MKLLLVLACALLHYHAEQIVPYNWLSLALLSSSEYNPRPYHHGDRAQYEMLCNRLLGLNPVQKAVCVQVMAITNQKKGKYFQFTEFFFHDGRS